MCIALDASCIGIFFPLVLSVFLDLQLGSGFSYLFLIFFGLSGFFCLSFLFFFFRFYYFFKSILCSRLAYVNSCWEHMCTTHRGLKINYCKELAQVLYIGEYKYTIVGSITCAQKQFVKINQDEINFKIF